MNDTRKQWPFVESPGEFTERLRVAMDHFDASGGLLAAVRNVLIENPPTLRVEPTPPATVRAGTVAHFEGNGPSVTGVIWVDQPKPEPGTAVYFHPAPPIPQNGASEAYALLATAAPATVREANPWKRNPKADQCKCAQMEVPAGIDRVKWYWQVHGRDACTLELPNKRCWCGLLRSEHIDGHADTRTAPPANARDAAHALLVRLQPFLDSIICYASTMSEYEGNALHADLTAYFAAMSAQEQNDE